MMKGLMSEASVDAIIGAEMAAGQPELVAAEIALMSMVIGIKKLK